MVTVWHLRDLCSGTRQMIKCDDVKVIQLPSYEGLTIDDFLEFAAEADNGKALKALPEKRKEIMKMPRSYIANVIYTIIGDPFQKWADKRVTERNEKVVKDRDMEITMDPEIAEIFKASSSVSGK